MHQGLYLKISVAQYPVLSLPYLITAFEVHIYASDSALSGVLVQ